MPQTKTAFVGTASGELAVMVTHTELVVTFDLGIPQAPAFVLKQPLEVCEQNPGIFTEMVGTLLESVLGYLEESGVPEKLVHAQRLKIEEAIKGIGNDDHSDRSGSGGSPLLEKVVELEPLDLFEAHFELVDGMIPAIYNHVVTGTWKRAGVRGTKLAAQHLAGLREALTGKELLSKPIKHTPPPVKLPHNFSTKPGPGTLTQNYPSVRTLVRKFKPQQGKPLTGPAFVLVYDVNGRPIGVRSIKGPGWKGIAASKTAACTKVVCSLCHTTISHCRCMRKFHDPNAPEFRGLIQERAGLCSNCSGKTAAAATQLVVNTCPSCHAVTMNKRKEPGEKAEETSETCRECRAKAERHEDPRMVAGRELLKYIDANHWVRFQLLQGPSGSVYVVFKGPVSQIPRKIRISDHAMTENRDPKKLHNSLPDLSIDPVSGVTLQDAKEWMKTAAKDMVVPEFSRTGQEIPVYINPTKGEIGGLLRKSDVVRLALSADGNTLLAWDAFVATHGQLREYLQLHGMADRNAVITLVGYPGGVQVTDGVKGTRWEHNPETAQVILNSPRIIQALGHIHEIGYYDEDIVGDWAKLPGKTARLNLTAGSFGPQDIPKNFWVVLDLRMGYYSTDFSAHHAKVFEELRNMALTGVQGISDTGQIIRQFGYRGAILRLPGAATVAANKLSRVMYGNPHYLLSNDMAALYRLFHKDPEDAYGHDGLMLVLAEYVMKALNREQINQHAYSDLRYYGAATKAGRAFQANPVSISNVHQLAAWVFAEFTRSWHEYYTGPTPPFTLEDISQACESALRYVGEVYGDEGEWVVKDSTLRIPQGSTLIVAFEDKAEDDVLRRWNEWTPEQREFDQTQKSPWLYGKVLEVQKQKQLREMLQLLPFKVSFVSKPQLEQTISQLNNQKAASLTAPKSKLFQETP
jgi:hypothetical protein